MLDQQNMDQPTNTLTCQVKHDEIELFTRSKDLMAVANFEGYFTRLNPQWHKELGWTLEELMSKPFIEFVHPEDTETTQEIAKVLASGEKKAVVNFDNRFRGKDSTYKWCSWTVSVDLEQAKYFAIARIIDKRKEMELHLISLEQALDRSHDIIFRTDLDGFITWINQAFTELYGYTIEEVQGQTPRILKSGKQSADFYKDFWAKISRGKLIQHEIINRTKAGKLVNIETNVSAIFDQNQHVIGYMAIQRDITARLAEQADLIKKQQELETLNKMMVGREIKMIQLKQENSTLKDKLAQATGDTEQVTTSDL